MRVRIHSASTTKVSPALFGGWGSVAFGGSSGGDSSEPLLCAVSGTVISDGAEQEVIAILDEEPPTGMGADVNVRETACFKKPKTLSHGAAAQFPFLALTAAAALHSVGLPPGVAAIGTDSQNPARVVIAGSSGRMPALLTQVLSARGVETRVAAQAGTKAQTWLDLGAKQVVDHNTVVFSEAFESADAVIDCVGRENNAELLRDTMGAIYVSAAPPALLALESEGALAQIKAWSSRWSSMWGGSDRREQEYQSDGESAACVWSADEAAGEALREALALVEHGRLAPPQEANEVVEVGELYLEWLNWVRDAETGQRSGFPGESMWPAEEAADQ